MKPVTSEGLRVHRVRQAQNPILGTQTITAGEIEPGTELKAVCGHIWIPTVFDLETLDTIPDCRDCLTVEYLVLGADVAILTDMLNESIKRRDEIAEQLHPTEG